MYKDITPMHLQYTLKLLLRFKLRLTRSNCKKLQVNDALFFLSNNLQTSRQTYLSHGESPGYSPILVEYEVV